MQCRCCSVPTALPHPHHTLSLSLALAGSGTEGSVCRRSARSRSAQLLELRGPPSHWLYGFARAPLFLIGYTGLVGFP